MPSSRKKRGWRSDLGTFRTGWLHPTSANDVADVPGLSPTFTSLAHFEFHLPASNRASTEYGIIQPPGLRWFPAYQIRPAMPSGLFLSTSSLPSPHTALPVKPPALCKLPLSPYFVLQVKTIASDRTGPDQTRSAIASRTSRSRCVSSTSQHRSSLSCLLSMVQPYPFPWQKSQ